jgi:hypothetical protein
MARGWIHTVNKGGQWVNEVEGGEILSRHSTKESAVAAGRAQAIRGKTEHLVRRLDGTIEYRNSYGNDPYPPRG